MQSENPIFADLVKLANSAAGTFAGMTREARDSAREKFKEAFAGMDFVTREEFDAVKDLAALARERAELLEARLTALEAKLVPASPAPAAADQDAGPGTGPGATDSD